MEIVKLNKKEPWYIGKSNSIIIPNLDPTYKYYLDGCAIDKDKNYKYVLQMSDRQISDEYKPIKLDMYNRANIRIGIDIRSYLEANDANNKNIIITKISNNSEYTTYQVECRRTPISSKDTLLNEPE